MLGRLGTTAKNPVEMLVSFTETGSVCWRLRRTMVSFATEHTAVSSSQVVLEGWKHMVAVCLKEALAAL